MSNRELAALIDSARQATPPPPYEGEESQEQIDEMVAIARESRRELARGGRRPRAPAGGTQASPALNRTRGGRVSKVSGSWSSPGHANVSRARRTPSPPPPFPRVRRTTMVVTMVVTMDPRLPSPRQPPPPPPAYPRVPCPVSKTPAVWCTSRIRRRTPPFAPLPR